MAPIVALATRNFAINWNTKKRVFRQFSLRFRKRFKGTLYLEGLLRSPLIARAAHAPPKHSGRNNVIRMRELFAPVFFLSSKVASYVYNLLTPKFSRRNQYSKKDFYDIIKFPWVVLLRRPFLESTGELPVNRCVCRYSLQNDL